MENKVQTFNSSEFGEFEVVLINGKEYFPATKCAKILGYSNPQEAIRYHCKGVREILTPTNGGNQKIRIIAEGDLYRLIVRSHLPEAQKFESWVFDEVLPSIRKHGMYFTPENLYQSLRDPAGLLAILNILQEEQQMRQQLEVENAFLSVKASYYDTILASKENLPITKIAKDYGMSAVSFNKMLHELKIQYLMGKSWVLYQEYANQGYTMSRTFILSEEKTVTHMYWTQKGRKFLYAFLLEHGILPVIEQEEDNEYI